MKILIHALGADTGGGIRHLTNFLPQIGVADRDREYTVLVRSSFPEMFDLDPNVRLERVPDKISRSRWRRLFFDLWSLPHKSQREGYGVIVSLTNSGPIWSPVPHVLFQRNALFYCPYYLRHIRGRLRIETALRRWHALASISRATMTVTPSNSMAQMIVKAHPHVRHRPMVTLYHGFDRDSLAEPLSPALQAVIDRIPRPRLFYPTHVAQYKGLDILFAALANLRERGTTVGLVVAGQPEDWPQGGESLRAQIRRLGLQDTVAFLGGVPQRQMGGIYRSCDVVVNPSLCESFGFSMIEALGHDLPVVAADLPINREICGDAAVYYPPLAAKSAADCIAEMIAARGRSDLAGPARVRLGQFDWSWRRYAREFAVLIDSALAAPAGKTGAG